MKVPTLLLAAVALCGWPIHSLQAAPVTDQQASNAILHQLAFHYPAARAGSAATGPISRTVRAVEKVSHEGQLVGYAVKLNPGGYYLVSADDDLPLWKLRADEGEFTNLPPGLLAVMRLEMAEELQALAALRRANKAPAAKYHKLWQSLAPTSGAEDATNLPTGSAGTYLLTTTWNQNAPYNYYCPAAAGGPGGRAYAGCTACAVSQILRYQCLPAAVAQDHSYADSSGACEGTHSLSDAGLGTYGWVNMPNSISTGSPGAQQQAIGQLMYHAAVALNSDFEANETDALPAVVPSVLRTYFSYTCGDLESKSTYTSAQWYSKIAADIDANKPVFYSFWQADYSAGHAVVCDGYQSGNEIHLNLGWSGSYNAWYNIDSVTAGGYTWTIHKAVFGITAPSGVPPATPILSAEPTVTPGTQNTITWSATALEYYAEYADNQYFTSATSPGWMSQTQATFVNLTPSKTYWFHVKAKLGGMQSGWSNVEHSQQEALPVLAASPATQDFGSIPAGTTADRTFTVRNRGGGTLSGNASVSAPFSIFSGGTYNLASGQTQIVTVRYSPVSPGNATQNVAFTGAAGASLPVSGVATGPMQDQLGTLNLSNGTIRFSLNGPVGSNYVIQCSSNLVNWTQFSTATIPAGGSTNVADEGARNQLKKFYRAVPQ